MKKLSGVVIVLLTFCSIFAIAFIQTHNSKVALTSEKEIIISNFQVLQNKYDVVINQNASISDQYSSLSADHFRLQSNYTLMENRLSSLTSNLNLLHSENTHLMQNYGALNETYVLLNNDYVLLSLNLSHLSGNLSQFQKDYDKLRDSINLHTEDSWPHGAELITPQDPLVKSLVYNITGVYFNVDDITKLWQDIYKLYAWVLQNITYRYDGYYPALPYDPSRDITFETDMWQFPNQTIVEKQGDCDDKAILLCSILRSYFNQTFYAECMRVSRHMSCYIPVIGNQIIILDPTMGYYTNTGAPNYTLDAKDVQTEVNDYLSWSGTEPVYYIFSDEIEKQFNTTQAFIDWIKERM